MPFFSRTRSKSPMRQRKESGRTLLESIGGDKILEEAVEIFCDRVITDPYLIAFVRRVNVVMFKVHLLAFVRIGLKDNGSQRLYLPTTLPQHLQEWHRRFFDMGLDETHFDRVISHLLHTLRDLQVKRKVVNEIYSTILLPFRDLFERHDSPFRKS